MVLVVIIHFGLVKRLFLKGYSTLAINLPGHGDNKSKGLSSIDEMAHI